MHRTIARLAGLVAVACLAFLAWQWPYTISVWHALAGSSGAPGLDATVRYPVIERVAGPERPLPGDDFATEDTRFSEAVAYSERMQSYALLVWQGGRLSVARYMNSGNRDTCSESASMHKSVMAMVVGQALADGRLHSLDDPVGHYLTEWADDDRGRITLRQVLQMSTGLSNASGEGGLLSEPSRFQFGLFPERVSLGQRLEHEPGTVFEYMNVNSNLMGLVLSLAFGERYADCLGRTIWQPLGASDAFVSPSRPGGLVKTASSLMATPRDWLLLGIMLAGGGVIDGRRVLPEGWVVGMTEPSPLNPNYGLQVWLAAPFAARRYYNGLNVGAFVRSAESFPAPDTAYFDGWGGQRVYVSRSEQLVIVHAGPERLDWDDSTLPNFVIAALQYGSPR